MATIKKPKLRAYPKRPKGKMTIDRAKSWQQKSDEVIAENAKRMKEYNNKVAARDKEKSQIGSIVSGIKTRKSKVRGK